MKISKICVTFTLVFTLLVGLACLAFGQESWRGRVSAPAYWEVIETWTGTVRAPAEEWREIESWTSPVAFKVTFVFRDPAGNPLSRTEIYYGFSSDNVAERLGTTDEWGKIALEDPKLANRVIYFKTSDGRHAGKAFVPTGGEITVELTEISEFPLLWIIATFAVVAIVVGAVVLIRKRRHKQLGPQAPQVPGIQSGESGRHEA